jgi:tetratricopeptide (TPR) repeat protein
VRRKDEWGRIRAIFPSNNVVLSIRKGAELKSLDLKPLKKKLLFLVSQGKTIAEMLLELHGSDFQVNFALFELYDMNVLEVKEVREALPLPEDPGIIFNRAQELMKAKRYQEAIGVIQDVLRMDPHNTQADELLESAEKALCQEYYRTSTPADKTPHFIVPEYALTRYSLSHQEGFVASRVNGSCDVKSIVMLSPLREFDILQILDKLIKLELIALK